MIFLCIYLMSLSLFTISHAMDIPQTINPEVKFSGTIADFKKHFGECDLAQNIDSTNFEDYLFELAFEKGNLPVAQWFVQKGCNVHKFYQYKDSFPQKGVLPLTAAVENGHLSLVNFLLAAGAEADGYCDKPGHCEHDRSPGNPFLCKNRQPIALAACKAHIPIYNALKSAGAHPVDASLLEAAVNSGDPAMIETLTSHIDSWGLIRTAVLHGKTRMVKTLLNLRSPRMKKQGPLITYGPLAEGFNYASLVVDSIRKNKLKITYLLLDQAPSDYNINEVSWSFWARREERPLNTALRKNKLALAKKLIKRGAWVNPPPIKGHIQNFRLNPLYEAAEADNIEAIQLLLQKGADPNHLAKPDRAYKKNDAGVIIILDYVSNQDALPIKNFIRKWNDKPNSRRIVQILHEHGLDQNQK